MGFANKKGEPNINNTNPRDSSTTPALTKSNEILTSKISFDQPQSIQPTSTPAISKPSELYEETNTSKLSRADSLKPAKIEPKLFTPIPESPTLPKQTIQPPQPKYPTGASAPTTSGSFPPQSNSDSLEIRDLQSLASQPSTPFHNKRKARMGTADQRYFERFGISQPNPYTETSVSARKDPLNLHAEFEPQDSALQPLLVRSASASSFSNEKPSSKCCCILV